MTTVEILDSNLNVLTKVSSFMQMTAAGTILTYSKELSDFGTCTFRISSYDTFFGTLGDILQPHANHVRIKRNNVVVWQGAIIDNPKRTKDYIEVNAVEYIWYLGKSLILRSSADPSGANNPGIYRVFSSGTMADAVNAIMNETITKWSGTN